MNYAATGSAATVLLSLLLSLLLTLDEPLALLAFLLSVTYQPLPLK
jgi:hypothetical protein